MSFAGSGFALKTMLCVSLLWVGSSKDGEGGYDLRVGRGQLNMNEG